MTPAARIAAAIDILDHVLDGEPAERALLRWSRNSRFAGSGDRAAVRDLVFDALRRRDSLARLGGSATGGRGLMLGHVRASGRDPDEVFTGVGHAPSSLTSEERRHMPDVEQELDVPDWLWPQWQASLGADAAVVAEAMRHRAPVWLRVNPRRSSVEEAMGSLRAADVHVERHGVLQTALRVLEGERRIARSEAYLKGLVELQDLSPQLACAAVPLRSGDHVLDYCAGGGGKTLALGGRQDGLRLVAHDAATERMKDLPDRAARADLRVNISSTPQGPFDLVVADVPCSGSGTWRRSPDMKWRLTPGSLSALVRTQSEILDRVATLVRPGGHLAYMTCSVLDAENDDQIAGFLDRDTRYQRVHRQSWTPLDAGDGFYLAILCRKV